MGLGPPSPRSLPSVDWVPLTGTKRSRFVKESVLVAVLVILLTSCVATRVGQGPDPGDDLFGEWSSDDRAGVSTLQVDSSGSIEFVGVPRNVVYQTVGVLDEPDWNDVIDVMGTWEVSEFPQAGFYTIDVTIERQGDLPATNLYVEYSRPLGGDQLLIGLDADDTRNFVYYRPGTQ